MPGARPIENEGIKVSIRGHGVTEKLNELFATAFAMKDIWWMSMAEQNTLKMEPEELCQITVTRNEVLKHTDKLKINKSLGPYGNHS